MQGIITGGNYAFSGHPTQPDAPPIINLTGDTEIKGGNFLLARIITNGHNLTLTSGQFKGLRIDNVKQDSYVYRCYGPHPIVSAITSFYMEKMRAKGFELWDIFWITTKATSATNAAELAQELDAALISADEDISGARLLDRMQEKIKELVQCSTFDQVVQWVKDRTEDQLRLKDTEVLQECD